MGLSRDDYLDSTPFEFERMHARWLEKIEKDRQEEFLQKMYVGRLMVFRSLCPPKGQKIGKDKMIKITDLWQLPGEEEKIKAERDKRASTKERFEFLKKLWG